MLNLTPKRNRRGASRADNHQLPRQKQVLVEGLARLDVVGQM